MYDYLFVGPQTNMKSPEKTGGVIVLFEDLLAYCNSNDVKYLLIDTNKANYRNLLVAYLSIWVKLFLYGRKVRHIAVHGTSNDYLYIVPFALLVSKLYGKSISLRKFGGNFIDLYKNYSRYNQWIVRTVLKYASSTFFETKYLVQYFKKYNSNTFWFPNVRVRKLHPSLPRIYKKSFVFIGHIRKSKGIQEILEASLNLDEAITIDLYGPIVEDYILEDIMNYQNVSYKGILLASNVLKVLNEYDVILLPSYQEGYPGIIIEAFSLGIPIIATNLESIREMIIDKKNGLLIPVGCVSELENAIESFNQNNYVVMSNEAYKSFENYDSNKITKRYMNVISS